jgi:hypothetical protein
MTVLTIDVGLRHLAMCIMSFSDCKDYSSYEIDLWDVYNVLDEDDHKCSSILKNQNVCNKKCSMKYKTDNGIIYCCKIHFPKDITPNKTHQFKIKKVDEYLLQDIASILLKRIQSIYDQNQSIFEKIKTIQIELQPKQNRKMIFISHILYGKLVELFMDNPKTTIRFVRASTKLRAYKGPKIECHLKGAYAKRKWLSVEYTKWILLNQFCKVQSELWLPILEKHKKLNDMTDTFCFAVNAIQNIKH